MANLKVITNPGYRNYSTQQSHQQRHRQQAYEIREDEGSYNTSSDDLLAGIKLLLEKPLWPEFPDGAYLRPAEAARLYRLAHGAQGLIHILHQSANSKGIAGDYQGEQHLGLTEFRESQVWAALIETGRSLARLCDELQAEC